MAYTPTEWRNGDVITAEKLNHIENGIGGSDGRAADFTIEQSGSDYSLSVDVNEFVNQLDQIIYSGTDQCFPIGKAGGIEITFAGRYNGSMGIPHYRYIGFYSTESKIFMTIYDISPAESIKNKVVELATIS